METSYTALKADLLDDDLITEKVERKAAEAHRKELNLRDEYEREMSSLAKMTRNILTENQLRLVEDFKPCLIPPKGPNQSKIGEASGDTTQLEKRMKQLRQMPERRFEFAAERLMEEYIAKLEEENGELTDTERHEERVRLMDLAYRVRNLSEPEFEVEKAGIAAELKAPFEKKKEETEKQQKKNITVKLGEFFLDTHLIPILQEKLENNKTAYERVK